MKTLTAIVRMRGARLNDIEHIILECETKKEFYEDLRGNGFKVLEILTDKQIEEYKNTTEEKIYWNTHYSVRNTKIKVMEYVGQVL